MLGVLAQSGVAEAAGFGAVTDFNHVYPAAGLKACQNGRVRHVMGTGVKQTHVLNYKKVGPHLSNLSSGDRREQPGWETRAGDSAGEAAGAGGAHNHEGVTQRATRNGLLDGAHNSQ